MAKGHKNYFTKSIFSAVFYTYSWKILLCALGVSATILVKMPEIFIEATIRGIPVRASREIIRSNLGVDHGRITETIPWTTTANHETRPTFDLITEFGYPLANAL